MDDIGKMPPQAIEDRSFAIILEELGQLSLPPEHLPIVRRVIHATADFDFARTLHFSPGAVPAIVQAFRAGKCSIVTDTTMALAGINKAKLAAAGVSAHCLIADADVARLAREQGVTRSRVAVDEAVSRWPEAVYVVGNAPTALLRLCELLESGCFRPAAVIGAPVGFVNVVESKDRLLGSPVPHIIAKGRKGGSTVAAAICNAILGLA